MNAQDKATERPWKINDGGLQISDLNGKVIARTAFKGLATPLIEVTPEVSANAALIVRAVNSHDALVEALERAESCLKGMGFFIGDEENDLEGMMTEIETALKLAKGE